jgi:gas vesicle protein
VTVAPILEVKYRWAIEGGRVNQSRVVIAGAVVGALIGVAATYLFFTDAGKHVRGRLEPAVDDLRREFVRFQKTIEKLGEMANDGLRVVNEFNAARSQSSFSDSRTSH